MYVVVTHAEVQLQRSSSSAELALFAAVIGNADSESLGILRILVRTASLTTRTRSLRLTTGTPCAFNAVINSIGIFQTGSAAAIAAVSIEVTIIAVAFFDRFSSAPAMKGPARSRILSIVLSEIKVYVCPCDSRSA